MLGNKEIMAKNIRRYMDAQRKSRNDVCEALGFAYSTFTDWINGNKYPRIDKIEMLANYFGVSKSDLVEEHIPAESESKCIRIPVYGKVAAGLPIEAVENIIDYEEIPSNWKGEYAALKVKGDSMSPRIQEGDVLIVKLQDDADSGDIVVALVDGKEATVKRLIKYETGITLQALNPSYEPMYFSQENMDGLPVRIWGKVVENRAKF